MSAVLVAAALVAGSVLAAAVVVVLLVVFALWVRVRRARRRGLGPSRNAAADTVELPLPTSET